MSFCTKISKLILFVFNTIFIALGLLCVVGGILVLVENSVLTTALAKVPGGGQTLDQALSATSDLSVAGYLLIAGGFIIFFISTIGCCGAIKEHKWMLIGYCVGVGQISSLTLGGGIRAYVYKDSTISSMRSFLNDTITEKYQGLTIVNGVLTQSTEAYSSAWDFAMINLECCGNYNYSDFSLYATQWAGNYSYGSNYITGAKVPVTCCKATDKTALISDMANYATYFTNSTMCLTNADPLYTNTVTCYDKIVSLVNTYSLLIFGAGITVLCVQIILITAAACLAYTLGKDQGKCKGGKGKE